MRIILAILNLLGYPGVGTYLAGHRRAGLIQILLHTAAFILSTGSLAVITCRAWPYRENLDTLGAWLADNCAAVLLPLTAAILGICLFLCNWLWSATTTKPAAKTPPPLPGER